MPTSPTGCGHAGGPLRRFQPLGSAQASPALRAAGGFTLAVLAFFAVGNLAACFLLQGVRRQVPGGPTACRFFTDLLS